MKTKKWRVCAIQIFLQTGSHFLTNADWGCTVGEHKAWIIMEGESEKEARTILPPAFRPQAKVTMLNKFTLEQIDQALSQHQA